LQLTTKVIVQISLIAFTRYCYVVIYTTV